MTKHPKSGTLIDQYARGDTVGHLVLYCPWIRSWLWNGYVKSPFSEDDHNTL